MFVLSAIFRLVLCVILPSVGFGGTAQLKLANLSESQATLALSLLQALYQSAGAAWRLSEMLRSRQSWRIKDLAALLSSESHTLAFEPMKRGALPQTICLNNTARVSRNLACGLPEMFDESTRGPIPPLGASGSSYVRYIVSAIHRASPAGVFGTPGGRRSNR